MCEGKSFTSILYSSLICRRITYFHNVLFQSPVCPSLICLSTPGIFPFFSCSTLTHHLITSSVFTLSICILITLLLLPYSTWGNRPNVQRGQSRVQFLANIIVPLSLQTHTYNREAPYPMFFPSSMHKTPTFQPKSGLSDLSLS